MNTLRPERDRRDSPRVLARLYVRGLGDDRQWSDRLGNLSLGGVGFEFPRAPEADRFQIAFSVPGDPRIRKAMAEVVDYDPLDGTLDREHPFFVRLRFARIGGDDERALARGLDRDGVVVRGVSARPRALSWRPEPSRVLRPPRPWERLFGRRTSYGR